MKNTARVLLALVGLFFFVPGVTIMVTPETFTAGLLIEPVGVGGLSHVRALLGGAITAIGLSALNAARTGEVIQARVAVFYVVFILLARTISYFIDGSFDEMVMFFVFPTLVFSSLLGAHFLLNRAEESTKSS